MRIRYALRLGILLPLLAGCSSTAPESLPPLTLLEDDFNAENGGISYALTYTGFARWNVIAGTVDLIGTPPVAFLPSNQGMYVDLDGNTMEAGTLQTKDTFELLPATYELRFSLAGSLREGYPPDTVIVSVGESFSETIILESHTPLETYTRTFRVRSRVLAPVTFKHLGGDNVGILLDDVRLRRQ